MNHSDEIILKRILKTLVKNGSASRQLLSDLASEMDLGFSVWVGEELMYGTGYEKEQTISLEEEGIVFGKLSGSNATACYIADILMTLIRKDFQKKRMGAEVLGLYREINMIYNFSELISEKIDDKSIAETALNEASQIIEATHGAFFILDETDTNRVYMLSEFGQNPDAENSPSQMGLLKSLIQKGTASIVSPKAIAGNDALNHLQAVMYAPLRVKHRTFGLIVLGHQTAKEFTAAELKLLTTIALQSAAAIESAKLYQKGLKQAQEREQALRAVHEASQKFIPHVFIKSLGKDTLTEVELGDLVEREVTVVFVDIRGFTTLAETMTPKENFQFINSFNKQMGPIVSENGGLIMQYLGDGFMALFPKGPQSALRASVQMQLKLHEYNAERQEKGRSPVVMGIGMQDGELVMGITGDEGRMDAAIIADTVNTAARIEGLSKHYGTSILLTGHCKDRLSDENEFTFRYLGPVIVKGKEYPVELYECIDGDDPSILAHKKSSMPMFEAAMDLYFRKEFAMAAVTFQKVVKLNAMDHTANLFLNRSAHLITQKIGEDWKGVEAMDRK